MIRVLLVFSCLAAVGWASITSVENPERLTSEVKPNENPVAAHQETVPAPSKSKTQEPQEKDDRLVIPGNDDNQVARRDFMKTKLLFSKAIFEGLTMGDIQKIESGVKEIREITKGEKWVSIDNAKYQQLTREFEASTQRLAEATQTKNIDAIAFRYFQMTTSCIDCHQHIRQAVYEF